MLVNRICFYAGLILILIILIACSLSPAMAESGPCGENLTWALDEEGILTISGEGPMIEYGWDSPSPWYGKRAAIRQVVIEEGVTTISDSAFQSYPNLTSVSLPDGFTRIEASAFCFCSNLTTINFPDSLTFIGQNSFNGCTSLEVVMIPKNVATIRVAAFVGNTGLLRFEVDPENFLCPAVLLGSQYLVQ